MGLVALQHVGLPRPGIEPVSPALAGGFLTTGHQEIPGFQNFDHIQYDKNHSEKNPSFI